MSKVTHRKKELVIAVIALAAALVIGFVLLPSYVNKQNSTIKVVVASQTLAEGTELATEHLAYKTIRSTDALEGTFLKIEDAVGKFVNIAVPSGDYITAGKLTDSIANSEKAAIARATLKSYRTVSFEMPSLASSVSAILRQGDLVSVLVYKDNLTTLERKRSLEANAAADAQSNPNATNSETGQFAQPDTATGNEDHDYLAEIVVVTKTLPAGHILTVEDLAYKAVESRSGQYANALARIDELIGHQLSVTIQNGDYLVPDNIVISMIPDKLHYVEIASLHVNNAAAPNEAETPDSKSTVPTTITFYMNEEQVLLMNEYMNSGFSMRLVFVARGEDRAKFVTQETLVME